HSAASKPSLSMALRTRTMLELSSRKRAKVSRTISCSSVRSKFMADIPRGLSFGLGGPVPAYAKFHTTVPWAVQSLFRAIASAIGDGLASGAERKRRRCFHRRPVDVTFGCRRSVGQTAETILDADAVLALLVDRVGNETAGRLVVDMGEHLLVGDVGH